MMRVVVAVATVAAILAGGDSCEDRPGSCGGVDNGTCGGQNQYEVMAHAEDHMSFGVLNYKLKLHFPEGPEWIVVTKDVYNQCSDHDLYPKCAR